MNRRQLLKATPLLLLPATATAKAVAPAAITGPQVPGPVYLVTKTEQRWLIFNPKKQRHVLHREDGPAVITKQSEMWYRNGKRHRDGGPANINYDSLGNLRTAYYYRNGKLHREDGPALISTGSIGQFEEWYKDGLVHRDGGPARFRVLPNGSTRHEWFRDGKRHRDTGPAIVCTDANGELMGDDWYRDGELFREDGPQCRNTDLMFWFYNTSLPKIVICFSPHYNPLRREVISVTTPDPAEVRKWATPAMLRKFEQGETMYRTEYAK